MQKTCKSCGKTMDIIHFYKNKYLKDGYENKCKKCRNKQRKKYQKTCKMCGKKFKARDIEQTFCSNKCSGKSKRNRVKVKCAYCGEYIEVKKSLLNANNTHYCNQDCRTEHLKEIMKGNNNPNYNRVEYRCDGCGKIIKVIPYKIKEQKYIFCSNDCYKKNIGKFFSGDKNGNWNSGLTKEERFKLRRYPEYYKWREAVYKRDDYTCQYCGDNKGGNLNAHHIYNYMEHPNLRLDLDNGVTLCNECHKLFHDTYGYRNNNQKQINVFLNKNTL